jgi:hypothetical protein
LLPPPLLLPLLPLLPPPLLPLLVPLPLPLLLPLPPLLPLALPLPLLPPLLPFPLLLPFPPPEPLLPELLAPASIDASGVFPSSVKLDPPHIDVAMATARPKQPKGTPERKRTADLL